MRAIDPLTEPIVGLYSAMQEDLIREIARRFDGYEKVTGALLWQVKMLSQTRALDADLVTVIARYSKKSEAQIRQMLEQAGFANLDSAVLSRAYRMGKISADPMQLEKSMPIRSLIDQSYRELNGTFRMIRTRALESARTAYMTAINRAYVEMASGVYDAPTAICRAVQDMAAQGITGATYQRSDGKTVRYDLEGVVRRDTLTAVHRLANDVSCEACKQIDATHVEVSSHIGARVSLKDPIANHAGWQGKIYRIDGTDEYPNLREKTGYPDAVQGLGGVNCRHRMYPFIPGVSIPAQRRIDPEENERLYRLTQQQRRYERQIRKLKRQKTAAEAMGDDESAKKLGKKLKEKQLAMNRFCAQNGLKRDWNREAVAQEGTSAYNRLIPENNASVDDTGRVIKPWTPDTAQTMARQINDFLDSEFDLRESKWSGNVHVVDSFRSEKTIARKNWSCDITIRSDADAGSVMHELLHARSVSYHTPLQFRTYQRTEEGAVSYLTKAISRQQGMFYNPSYRNQVFALEQMRSFLWPNESDLDFALEFYRVDMLERGDWLLKEISNASANISRNERQYLENLFYENLSMKRWYE